MAGMLTLKELQQAVAAGEIDTVVACFPDMQGRLIGKRFQAEYFLGGAHEETHGCDYLLANDIDMEPVPGYAVANWEKGYGDFVMKPDLARLRRIPWLPATALVLCDILDHHTHKALAHAPRTILRKQRGSSITMDAASRNRVKNMTKKPVITAKLRSTSGPPEKSNQANARNHATALSAILVTAGWTPDAIRKAAVNELVSLKPTISPIFVTDGAGFASNALARSMRQLVGRTSGYIPLLRRTSPIWAPSKVKPSWAAHGFTYAALLRITR